MSTPTTTTEERQRIQQRYERLLRERAAAALMGEAAATAAAEAHEQRHGVGTNPTWYPPSFLQASTQQNPFVINPARIEAAVVELSDPHNINLTPRPAHQSAPAPRGARTHSGVAAPSPPAAASPAASRQREFQPLDLSRQPSQQLRHTGASGTAVAGPSQAYGPQAAGPLAGPSVTYAPTATASAAHAQTAGPSATYSQVPRTFATYGPAAGPSNAQPQPAVRPPTFPHVAGHFPSYTPAEREGHLTKMEDHMMQVTTFETYRDAGPNSYVYSEQESTTSTVRCVYYTPQMAITPSHTCPLGNASSSQGPTPLTGYPPMMPSSQGAFPQAGHPPMMPSSEGSTPRAGYPPMVPSSQGAVPQAGFPPVTLSSEGAVPQAGYPQMIPSSEGSTLRAGYPPTLPSSEGTTVQASYTPMVSYSARPSHVQMAPHYSYGGVPHPTAGYQQTWPATSIHQQAAASQGYQPVPSRSRPTKRPVPVSGQRTNLRLAAEFDSPIQAGPHTGQAPSQATLKGTVEAHTLAVKSEPVKLGGDKRESIPVVRIIPIETKLDDQVCGIPTKKVPGEKMIVRRDVAHGQYEVGTESKVETNSEATTNKVADVDREGDADPVADIEKEVSEDAGRQYGVEEYEPGPNDGECEVESSCSDGGNGQQPQVPTWQQQLRVPPQEPWAAVGGAPRPSNCRECARLNTPGVRCVSCRWRPMPGELPATTVREDHHSLLLVTAGRSYPLRPDRMCFTAPVVDTRNRPGQPSAARGSRPAPPAAEGSSDSTVTGSASAGRTGSTTAQASGAARRSVITAGGPSAQIRTRDSSVQVDEVSESEYESYSTNGSEDVQEEGDESYYEEEVDEAGEEEDTEEEQEDEEEEYNDNEDEQESADEAVEKSGKPHDTVQQEEAQSTTASLQAHEENEGADQSSEEPER